MHVPVTLQGIPRYEAPWFYVLRTSGSGDSDVGDNHIMKPVWIVVSEDRMEYS